MPRSSRSTSAKGGQVTLTMVAARAGVSPQTVSNAINSPAMLRPETLERVSRVIEEMGYRPSRAAQTLRTRSSRLIGYGVQPGPASSPVLDRFLHALSQAADEAGYRILLFAAPPGLPSLDGYEELLDQHEVDGFVLSGTEHGDPRQAWLAKRDVPFVGFGRMWSGRQIGDWVDVDGASGTDAAVEHLVSLGHRRIAFLGWERGSSAAGDDRAEGWLRAMRRHGLPTRGRRAQSVNEIDAARTAVRPLLDGGATAVIAASDMLALGCYQTLRERGAAPGRDVAVVGFDDSPTAGLLFPALTSVAQPLEEVGRECVRLLLARIGAPDAAPERLLLEPSLVVRDSAQAVGGGATGGRPTGVAPVNGGSADGSSADNGGAGSNASGSGSASSGSVPGSSPADNNSPAQGSSASSSSAGSSAAGSRSAHSSAPGSDSAVGDAPSGSASAESALAE
ncbi:MULTISPECIES: LacI family DNA-binding transcriptional regulator [unclassified Streptomyces]|uniref:LacI family DNA-binding transcriptional regulator n=1 Tax=unclassified Streptomyces TaxID=2593676 RepID=UPI002E29686D|nr:LacI family DNA-binding transcriptional regulator [Streptomyces sp. NBC_00228]